MSKTTAKKQKSSLNLLIPDMKTIYVGCGYRQKATYIQLPEKTANLLKEDVKNGAAIYQPLLSYFDNKASRYSIITAPSMEDGFRAVTYLACEDLERDSENGPDYTSLYDPAIYENQLIDANYDEIDELIHTYDDEEDDDYLNENDDVDENNRFDENPYRIPLVDCASLLNSSGPFADAFGHFNQEMNSPARSRRFWWEHCTEESICIFYNAHTSNFFMNFDILSDELIDNLKRFRGNPHVYVLIISDTIKEDDLSLTKCMLEYTANLYRLAPSKSDLNRYYQTLLTESARKYHFRFSAGLDLEVLTEKLSNVNAENPCRIFEKIMLYFTHKGVKGEIVMDNLTSLGLSKLFTSEESSSSLAKMKEELWGMERVKKQVDGIMNTMNYQVLRQKHGLKTSDYHNVHLFIGAPGTAKTTVAKYMAGRMVESGLLKGDRFISVSGAQLKAPYLGQTAHKVHALFQDYDAILIDEAYSLTSDTTGQDSYSEEALAQLAIELEEHGASKLIIFAGYGGKNVTKENNRMYRFLESNPGIKSRISSTIVFDSYSPDEMTQIIHHMLHKNGLNMNAANDALIRDYFAERCISSDFGNGREARNFVELLQRFIAGRIMSQTNDEITDTQLNSIVKADIVKTIAELKEANAQQIGQDRLQLGF